jgi:hypothetical protein
MRNLDSIRMVKSDAIRRRQRSMVNAQDLTQAFRMQVNGMAGTGVSYSPTSITFDAPFRPSQGENGWQLRPSFTYGFELTGDPPTGINALTGFAKVTRWDEDSNGYVTGCQVEVAVCLMNSEVEEMEFYGFVHLQFTGPVVMTIDYQPGGDE